MRIQQVMAQAAFHGHGHGTDPVQGIIDADLDPRTLLRECLPHRIIGRLARRFEHESSPSARRSPDIAAAVFDRQAHIEIRSRRFVEEIVRIQSHLASRGHRSILLKGPSVNLVSGGRAPQRFFSDIDLVVENTGRADVSTIDMSLTELGYEHVPQWPCGIHEAGHFICGDSAANFRLGGGGFHPDAFQLDVHHGFPAWGYPDIAVSDVSRPGRIDIDRDGKGHSIDQDLIGYAEMAAEVREVETPFGAAFVLSPEASALVSCANIFKDAFKPHWTEPTTVRLGYVAEVLDLTEHPGFDTARFRELARSWSMVDAVSFVAEACEYYTSWTPSALRTADVRSASDHLTVWNRDHYPVMVRADRPLDTMDNRVVRELTMLDHVASLGAETLTVDRDGGPSRNIVVGGSGSRTFTHRIRDRTLDMSLVVAWGDDTLDFAFHIATDRALGSECVLLNFGDPALEVYRPVAGASPRVRNRAAGGGRVAERTHAEWRTRDDGTSVLTVRIPRSLIAGGPRCADEIGFICGLQDHVAHDHSQNASVFTPVRMAMK